MEYRGGREIAVHRGRVTGKGKDAQELRSSFGQVLHLLFEGFISAFPALKGEQTVEKFLQGFVFF